ncbi:hypothetical protein DA717_14495 [Piscirickettsiaceae bacterium NZ-RLO2]|uniref:hypothetical protein n=1 Tax=Piscirickettsia salmonis TaxID=1238 RepID=UPI000F07E23A|nr:hypothetical protein DA717_14495 [Piscirickettsiaceae bacterium NZ-RLO2]
MNRKHYNGLAVSMLALSAFIVPPLFAVSAQMQIHARVIHAQDVNALLQQPIVVQALRSGQANLQQTQLLSSKVAVKVNVRPGVEKGVRQVILINH